MIQLCHSRSLDFTWAKGDAAFFASVAVAADDAAADAATDSDPDAIRLRLTTGSEGAGDSVRGCEREKNAALWQHLCTAPPMKIAAMVSVPCFKTLLDSTARGYTDCLSVEITKCICVG